MNGASVLDRERLGRAGVVALALLLSLAAGVSLLALPTPYAPLGVVGGIIAAVVGAVLLFRPAAALYALVFVKLLLGTGRARRGEVLNAGQFVRGAAVIHLVRAIRGRFGDRSTTRRDIIDPLRRFERDFPEWGARIAEAASAPVEDAARGLYDLAREILEPGWDAFPARAADAVARRLGF